MTEEAKEDTVVDKLQSQELPYAAEYAKTGRAGCKGCKQSIAQGALKMAVRFASHFFDGMQDNWHHFECFWKKARKNNMNETSIRGMEWLKWEDQEAIRNRILDMQALPDDFGTPRSAIPKVEYAKSSNGKCFKCKEKIEKGKPRIGFRASFYHVRCYKEIDVSHKPASEITGFDTLDDEDKTELQQIFVAPPSEDKKRKLEQSDEVDGTPSVKKPKPVEENEEIRAQLKKQSDILWNMREKFADLTKEEIEELIEVNGRYKPKKGGRDAMLDQLVDCAVFGVPEKCRECDGGVLVFSSSMHTYKCHGFVSEYTRCNFTMKQPERTLLKVPRKMKEEYDFLADLQSPILPSRSYPSLTETEKVVTDLRSFAKLDTVKKGARFKGESGSKKIVVKNGCTVDSKCDVAESTHVYIDPNTKTPWQATLGATDVQSGKNSFYKLQLLKDDDSNKYYLFRAWGRIGTTIGGVMTDKYGANLDKCMAKFEELFKERTRNDWSNRHEFKKSPFGMDIIEIDFDGREEIKAQELDVHKSKSSLPMPIKEIIAMIFDINAMNKTMKEFEIDVDKMPLGKLSRKHVLSAYKILTELQEKLSAEKQPSFSDYLDATNRFYTLIPHSTGLENPPMLNTPEIIRTKAEMLDNLLEMEVAFKLIHSEATDGSLANKDVFDAHFEKLNCEMEVLDKESEEFELVKKYAMNTHGATHDSFKLEIVDVLKIDRGDESKKFAVGIGNVHLLWHGSRTSNYVGILSQGLRIAPPEAPVTGYMFGKGIYTADMVSKSANYCHAFDSEGLLVLCEVALGSIQEEKKARNIKRLKKTNNSVKGFGETIPNPDETIVKDGITIPWGKPITSKAKDTELMYNEYIVYNENQVRMKYLVKAKFISGINF